MSNDFNKILNIQRDEEEDRLSRQRVDKSIFCLLIAAIVLIPLLVGGHISDIISPLITDNSILISGTKGDIFTFYKFSALMTLTVIAVGLFLYKLFFLDYRLPKRPILWFFCIFIISIISSTSLSSTKTIALHGLYNRSDGALSYICYVLLMFVAMHIEYPKKAVEYVLYAFYPLVVINFILITMNFTGHDALTYEPVQRAMSIFLPEGTELSEGSTLAGTLNHFNYLSGMFAIMAVMYLSWAIIDKNKIRSLVNLIVALISIAIILMALSRSGFLTLVCIIPFIIWLAIKSANKKIALVSFVVFCMFSVSIFHVLASKNPKVWDESIGFFISSNPYAVEEQVSTSFNEGDWNPLELFETTAYAADTTFLLPVLPESGVGAGSGRVYIWEKTLQLTMERPLFGYGLDTLMYNFPHGNIDSRANLETETVIVDKPHNMYLGVLYGTGIVGFIGFMGLVIVTVWASLKTVIRFNASSGITVILGIAWLAFLVQALFNDSLPGTAGPLWLMAGVMMGLLYTDNESSKQVDW